MGLAPNLFIHTTSMGKSRIFSAWIAIFWSHHRLHNQTGDTIRPLCGNFAVCRLETIEFK